MDFNTLIGMDIERAASYLTDIGKNFNTVEVETFKLTNHDCTKVVKYNVCKDGGLTLYLCKFKRGVDK